MTPAAEAEAIILGCVVPLKDVETVAVDQAAGRILAADLTSPLDFPHWDNSAMDGYAVRYADVENAGTAPVTLEVIEEIPAGQSPNKTLAAGQAARILTGSMLPKGADTIVIQEVTQRQGTQVTILEAPKPEQFVRSQGSYLKTGNSLMAAGTLIGAAEIAVLAAAQQAIVPVFRRPRVAILSTGDELVSVNQPLQPGQIVDSNQYALKTLVEQAGAVPVLVDRVADDPEALKGAIAAAVHQADLVISSGGVSVGDYDYVDEVLASLGGHILIRSVAVKPGKPLTVAQFQTCLYFGLPGNPASAMVGFWRFIAPALRQLAGVQSASARFIPAVAGQDLKAGGQRETYLWGRLTLTEQGYEFRLATGGHSSGNLINLVGTNALARVPVGQTCIVAGSPVSVMVVSLPTADLC
ncbi:molybdopterin molybdenumtransferase [filamentous cyanobacterium CCP5]|nr:molybdopterin molybdenumtransferase [filamentous cyanobacterium CCP5]